MEVEVQNYDRVIVAANSTYFSDQAQFQREREDVGKKFNKKVVVGQATTGNQDRQQEMFKSNFVKQMVITIQDKDEEINKLYSEVNSLRQQISRFQQQDAPRQVYSPARLNTQQIEPVNLSPITGIRHRSLIDNRDLDIWREKRRIQQNTSQLSNSYEKKPLQISLPWVGGEAMRPRTKSHTISSRESTRSSYSNQQQAQRPITQAFHKKKEETRKKISNPLRGRYAKQLRGLKAVENSQEKRKSVSPTFMARTGGRFDVFLEKPLPSPGKPYTAYVKKRQKGPKRRTHAPPLAISPVFRTIIPHSPKTNPAGDPDWGLSNLYHLAKNGEIEFNCMRQPHLLSEFELESISRKCAHNELNTAEITPIRQRLFQTLKKLQEDLLLNEDILQTQDFSEGIGKAIYHCKRLLRARFLTLIILQLSQQHSKHLKQVLRPQDMDTRRKTFEDMILLTDRLLMALAEWRACGLPYTKFIFQTEDLAFKLKSEDRQILSKFPDLYQSDIMGAITAAIVSV